MLKHVQEILQKESLLNSEQCLIVGVSGGADSLTLLDVLVKVNCPVVVAHFNHLMRHEANEDAQVVEKIAAKFDVPFNLGEGSVPDYAEENSLSIEEAARDMRYRFLFDQAEFHEAQAVAVAHNADDQVETVLMHLLRGAGLDGLTGMTLRSVPNPWSDIIPLVRPLLGVWRSEIVAYCAEHDLAPLIDATNADTTYFRNRLRHVLIPELETYVPGIRNRLWRTAELLTADRLLLDELTNAAWEYSVEQINAGFIVINPSSLNHHSLGLQRRLIRKALSHLRPGARNVDFAMVQRILDFVCEPTATGQADIGLGLRIAFEDDSLIISDWQTKLPKEHWPQIADQLSGVGYQGTLPIPGELHLGNDWILKAEIPPDGEIAIRDARGNSDPYQAWIDLGEREPLLNIRSRLLGDRFQPLGMEGKSMKISDFMINQKIPQRARAGWPLVCYGDEIVWVTGYQTGYPSRVTTQARRVVNLRLFVE